MRQRQSDQDSKRSTLPRIPSETKGVKMPKYDSPFAIPDDAEIFRMKEREKQRKREEKERNEKLKVWEKGVKKQGISIRELENLGRGGEEQPSYQSKASFIQAAKNAIKNRVKVNEPMHDFVSKKRETLLFQMLIDHKREKINEFQQLTKLHKKGLERAEQMLEQDMENFNSYLGQNKKQARDAIKKAEIQTRKKNEKVAIIKEKQQVQADLTGKNISKKETLQNLKKYKNFLESLSPQLSEQQRKKRQERVESYENNQFASANLNDQLSSQSDEEEMYFKEPEQLASIFHSLEQSNLFLITNLKEIQQQIEEAKTKFNHKKQSLTAKKNQLLLDKAEIQKQMTTIDDQVEQLKKTTNKDEISDYYANLQAEILRISKETKDIASTPEQKNISALDLLKDIEKKIEQQLLTLKLCKEQSPNIVKEEEKHRNAIKREDKKKKNEAEQQQRALKQKAETSPERQRRKGRPIMTRSIIKKEEKKKEVLVEQPIEEIERRKYLM